MKPSTASSRVTGLGFGQWVTVTNALVLTVMVVILVTTTTTTTSTTVSHSTTNVGFGVVQVQGAVVKSFPPRTDTPHGFQNQNQNEKQKQKHPLEDVKSWKLHVERRNQHKLQEEDQSQQKDDNADGRRRRNLATKYVKVVTDEKTPYTVLHKQIKPHLPFAGGDTTHGMMIDAGSQGMYWYVCFRAFIVYYKQQLLMLEKRQNTWR